MKLSKRDCPVHITLNRSEYCAQEGKLIVNGQEFEFAATTGVSQFFGQLLGIICSFLGSFGYCDNKYLDHKAGSSDPDDGHHRLHGKMLWDYRGHVRDWHFIRDVESCYTCRENTELEIRITEYPYDEAREKQYTLKLPIMDFAYAVAKCATEVIKQEGFWGYYRNIADKEEEFIVRQLLYVKACALGVADDLKYTDHNHTPTCLQDELELLLFDM